MFVSASASRVQRYATCPLSYFFGYALGIEPLEKPEEAVTLPPDRRGTFVHSVLERYLNKRMPAGEGSSAKLMADAFHEVKAEWEREETIGFRKLWEIESADLKRRLLRWVDHERAMEESLGVTPVAAEMGFGRDETAPVELQLDDGATVQFNGSIDRVDRAGNGDLYVFDYKSGSAGGYRVVRTDPADAGRKLQLALYSQAVLKQFPDAGRVHAAYWFVLQDRLSFEPPPEEFDYDLAKARLDEILRATASAVGAGTFPPNPGAPRESSFANCRYCAYDRVCPSGIRRRRMLDAHKEEPRLKQYFDSEAGKEQEADS